MPPPPVAVRVAIAGAASLRGKDMKQCLEESHFLSGEARLFDEDFVAGTLTEAAGEPAIIETVDEDSFQNVRFAFFTGSASFSLRHVAQARATGATVIDLSGGLRDESGARPWIPALDSTLPSPANGTKGESQSLFLSPSAPANVAISLSAAFAPLGLERLVLTFFEPVSERDQPGIEELESQTVQLMAFGSISQVVFDAQVGFNMLGSYGEASKENLADIRLGYLSEVRKYLAGRLPMPAISVVQTPVFYSHAFTAYAEFKSIPTTEDLEARLQAAGLKVTPPQESQPTNVNVTGEARPVLGQPERDPGIEKAVWLWGVADNLRVPTANAVAIAEKLLAS